MPRKKDIAQASLWSLGEEKEKTPEEAPKKKRSRKTVLNIRKEEEPEKESAVFSVGDYLSYLGKLVGKEEVVVQGEISGFKNHQVGGFFSLKDQEGDGLLKCYIPPRFLSQLGFDLEDGLLVNASGLASIYRPRGELSFTVHNVSLVGDGSIRQAYEALKRKLEEEGLFTRKRDLPEFIERIGFITAKTGEVFHDFRRNLKPLGFTVDLLDVRVQGNDAPPQIVEALDRLNREGKVDVIVIARGGGSLEDLQAFNDERVARAIFKSHIPVLAAIGHARDIPIAYMVADAGADTPTAAAITMNRSWERLESALPLLTSELMNNFSSVLEEKKNITRDYLSQLVFGIEKLLRIPREFRARIRMEVSILEKKTGEIKLRTRREITTIVQSLRMRLDQIRGLIQSGRVYLEGVSPERNLRLGYSIVMGSEGQVIKRIDDIKVGDRLSTLLAEGSFVSEVESIKKEKNNG